MILAFLIYSLTFRHYSHYSVASTNQAAFFIGGRHGSESPSSVIAKYENDDWSPLPYGSLKRRRYSHGSITSGTTTFVIGGWTDNGS